MKIKLITTLLLCLAVAKVTAQTSPVIQPMFSTSQSYGTTQSSPSAITPSTPAPLATTPPPATTAPATPASAATALALANPGYRLATDGSPIFGSQLFQGDFKNLSFTGFNPNYQIGVGDIIQVMIWGAMDNALNLTVDLKGNIFLPKVGPVEVLGVRNDDLNKVLTARIREVYKDNVESYAHLQSTQTVKVFVSGYVSKPGLYQGFSSDSVLFFLDLAAGIDPQRGSYLNVSLLRNNKVISTANLYDFLEKGTLPITQFRDGDVILVEPRGYTVTVTGNVVNPARFEFQGATVPLDRILALASPASGSTSVSVRRARGGNAQAIAVTLDKAATITLEPGDQVEVTARNVTRNLLVSFTGEHDGPSDIVFPHGTLVSDAIKRIVPTNLSDISSVQLFRRSVADRQKSLLSQSLDNLERTVLNASSSNLEEARLRQVEAETIFAFIARARQVVPKGQILLKNVKDAESIYLEDGDVLYVPAHSNLVSVQGEVKYPNTQTYSKRDSLSKYIANAGGFTERANTSEIIVLRPNGALDPVGKGRGTDVGPGDEIMVMPKTDSKNLLFAQSISGIIYQIAIGARVIIGL